MNPPEAPPPFAVLVVSGGGFTGLGLVKALREAPLIRVIVADCYEENVSRYFADGFYRVPKIAAGEAFVSSLLEVCAQERVALVFPATPLEVESLSENRDRFSHLGTEVAVPEPALVRLVHDKRALYDALGAAGLSVLPRVDPRNATLPFIGKLVSGWGSRGAVVVSSEEGRAALGSDADRDRVFQPYLEECQEFSVDFGIDLGGRASGLGLRERVRTSGGFAVISDSVESREIHALAEALVPFLVARGGKGLFNVQILRQGEALYLSDVNARLGTSAVHWCGTGFNPVLHVCASLKAELEPGVRDPARLGKHRSVRYLEELRIDAGAELRAREEALRGIVFDLDDTLLRLKGWFLGKLERLLEERGADLPALFLPEAMRLLEEGAAQTLFDALAERFHFEPALRDSLIADYRRIVPRECPLFPDVLESLRSLKAAGFALALLTDNPVDSQKQKVAASGLEAFCDAIVYSREAGAEKPDPRGFLRAAELLGLSPRALAMVGDNPYRDIQGALEAGYGMGYLVARPGSLVSFDPLVSPRVLPSGRPLRSLPSLRALLWYLGRGLR